jgi:hypothetical protein
VIRPSGPNRNANRRSTGQPANSPEISATATDAPSATVTSRTAYATGITSMRRRPAAGSAPLSLPAREVAVTHARDTTDTAARRTELGWPLFRTT